MQKGLPLAASFCIIEYKKPLWQAAAFHQWLIRAGLILYPHRLILVFLSCGPPYGQR